MSSLSSRVGMVESSTMLSVLQVSTFYSTHGGVEKSVSDLVSGLRESHDVRVLCTQRASGISRQEIEGVPVTAVGSRLTLSGRPVAVKLPLELARQRCDIVHYHLPFPLAMASHLVCAPDAKISIATWHHDIVNNPRFKKLTQPILDSFLDKMDVILATAPALIENTAELYKRRHKCRVVPLGIDDKPFNFLFEQEPHDRNEQSSNPMVLFVGRLVYYKGIDVLIKAMQQVEATLVVVGEGPLSAELAQLSDDLGISNRIKFLGRVADSELVQLYRSCDVFVLPSTLETECFGLVQVEAMLAGKPVVNTQLPTGVPWVSLHGETGLTVQPADVDELAGALKTLLSDSNLRSRLGDQARKRAQDMFTLSNHVRQISDLYRELRG